jgi:hypothetical protein
MKRDEILDTAKACVCGEREQDYGTPERNFGVIAEYWNAYLSAVLSHRVTICEADVAVMMCLFKIGRITTGVGTLDSFVDLAGYAACAGEIETGGNND